MAAEEQAASDASRPDPAGPASASQATASLGGARPDVDATVALGGAEVATVRGRFHILRPHARGNLGEVFVARDEELGREVALKEIQTRHADVPESRERFMIEAEVTGGLEHPGIVPVYGLGTNEDGRPYYAMRFIRGESLKQAIDDFHRPHRRGDAADPWRSAAARKLLTRLIDVCNAIEYAHSRGVIHRDIKPGNIMLGKYGETMVVDWGLAKTAAGDRGLATARPTTLALEPLLKTSSGSDAGLTATGSLLGTPAYAAPEQIAGRTDIVGPASDVYSLGATLYHILAGRPPFSGTNIGEILAAAQRGHFPPPRSARKDVPAGLEAICLKAMALEPAERYPTAAALATDLEHWLADEPLAARRDTPGERLARLARRHRAWALAGAAAVAIIAATGVVAALVINGARQREVAARQRATAALADEAEQRRVADESRRTAEAAQSFAEQAERDAVLRFQQAEAERRRAEAALDRAERSAEYELMQVADGIIARSGDAGAVRRGTDVVSRFLDARRALAQSGGSTTLVDAILSQCLVRHPLPLATYRGHRGKVYTIVISPDGLLAATGSIDQTVHVWNLATGERIASLGHDSRAHSIAFSADGGQLLTGDGGGTLTLWRLPDGEIARRWEGHETMAWQGGFSADGSRIVTTSADGELRIWDAASERLVRRFDSVGGEMARQHRGPLVAIVGTGFAPGKQASPAEVCVTLVDPAAAETTTRVFRIAAPQAIAWAPDDEHLLITGVGVVFAVRADGQGGVHAFQGRARSQLLAIDVKPDSDLVATGGVDGRLQLWRWNAGPGGDAPNLVPLQTIRGHDETVVSLAWIPASGRFASVSLDGTAKTWALDATPATRWLEDRPAADAGWRPEVAAEFGEGQPATDGQAWCWLADDGPLAIVRRGNSLVCQDVRTGRELARADLAKLAKPAADPPACEVAFGTAAAAGSVWLRIGDGVYRWNLEDGTVTAVVPLPDEAQVVFSPAGNLLFVAGPRDCQVWDLAAARRRATMPPVRIGFFAPDGGEVAVFDADSRMVRMHATDTLAPTGASWPIDPGQRWDPALVPLMDWKGSRLLLDTALRKTPTLIDLAAGVVQRPMDDRLSFARPALSADGEWLFARNGETEEFEAWSMADPRRVWSGANQLWVGSQRLLASQWGGRLAVLDRRSLDGFLAYQRGICDGEAFATNAARSAADLVGLAEYYLTRGQGDLAAPLLEMAAARGAVVPPASLALALDMLGDVAAADAAYDRAAAGPLPEWFCRVVRRGLREPAAAAAAGPSPRDYLRLTVDMHLARGDHERARVAVAQGRTAGLLDEAEATRRRAEIDGDERQQAGDIISWRDAAKHVGRRVTVEGTVVQTTNIGRICFLNFVSGRRDVFVVPVFQECFAAWPEPPEERFLDRTVRVSGKVSLHKGTPQIEVHSAGQIAIIDAAEAVTDLAVAPPPAADPGAGARPPKRSATIATPREASPAPPAPLPAIGVEGVPDHLDQAVVLSGTIATVVAGDDGVRLRLQAAGGPGCVVHILPQANLLAVDRAGAGRLEPGRTVRVSGRLVGAGSDPTIVVHDAEQIAWPPPAAAPAVPPAEVESPAGPATPPAAGP